MIAYSKNLSVVDNSELSQKGGTVTVPGLSGGTTYFAKVVARNCVGASVPAIHSLALCAVVSVFVSSCLYSCVVWSPTRYFVLFYCKVHHIEESSVNSYASVFPTSPASYCATLGNCAI